MIQRSCFAWWLFLACLVAIPAGYAQDVDLLEQETLYAAATQAAPGVVRIETIGGLEKVGRVLVNMGPTSGVIVDREGYIISSSFNFIQQPSSILVQLPDGQRKPAKIVARDESRKLVLLKVEVEEPLEPIESVSADDVAVGQWTVTVGRTLPGGGFNVSMGILSAKNRIWGRALQTDANVSPANYGGALVDIRGRVIGVLVPLSPDSSNVVAGAEWYDSGIGFCIPMYDILRSLELLKAGDIYPGKLGVAMKGSNAYADELIVAVSRPNSPAREAGINKGDKILAINGIDVRTHSQMKHVLGPLNAGETVAVRFESKGQQLEKQITLIDKLLPYEHAFLGVLPVREQVDVEQAGVTARYVYPDSPAAKVGIQVDDSITAVNGEAVTNAVQLRNLLAGLEPKDEVSIRLKASDEPREVSLRLATLPEDVPTDLPAGLPELDESNEDLPPLGKINIKLPEEEGDCVAYVPESYDPRFRHSLLVVLPVPGDNDVQALMEQWKDVCDQTRTLLLMPQAKEARSWMPTETKFVRKTIENLRTEYAVDPERIALCGVANSGSMALLCALTDRDLVRGAVTINGAVPSRAPSLINEPLQRFAAFVVAGKGIGDATSSRRCKADARIAWRDRAVAGYPRSPVRKRGNVY